MMTQQITRKMHFYAAHRAHVFPDGHKCRSIHGHTYEVEIVYQIPNPGECEAEFSELDRPLAAIHSYFDHSLIMSKDDDMLVMFEEWNLHKSEPYQQKLALIDGPSTVENLSGLMLNMARKQAHDLSLPEITQLSLRETTSGVCIAYAPEITITKARD